MKEASIFCSVIPLIVELLPLPSLRHKGSDRLWFLFGLRDDSLKLLSGWYRGSERLVFINLSLKSGFYHNWKWLFTVRGQHLLMDYGALCHQRAWCVCVCVCGRRRERQDSVCVCVSSLNAIICNMRIEANLDADAITAIRTVCTRCVISEMRGLLDIRKVIPGNLLSRLPPPLLPPPSFLRLCRCRALWIGCLFASAGCW